MSQEVDAFNVAETPSLHVPPARKPLRGKALAMTAVVLLGAAGLGLYRSGHTPPWLAGREPVRLTTRPVDEGRMAGVVVENGTLESSDNAAVKCQVEALLGMTGWSTGLGAVSTPKNSSGGLSVTKSLTSRGAAVARAGASKGSAGAGGLSAAAASSFSGSAAGTTSALASAASYKLPKPPIRSFSYAVPAYNILRYRVSPAVARKNGWVDPSASIRGLSIMDRPGSTRILWIEDQGKHVKAGDVICRLDSSKFEEEVKAQMIRYLQAKAWVDQARSILEVNQITLREYQDGVFPQDLQLLNQYIRSCETVADRARKTLEWSRETTARGFRSRSQLTADELAVQEADFRLREAGFMANRVERYTGPRLIRRLQAKIEAIKSDLYSQEAGFQLEVDRLRRLKAAVENCTMRAPRDGIVVYHNPPNMWGRLETQVREGTVVREGQTIIDLPDPRHMRVRARINESKIAAVRTGLKVDVSIDAFPERPMKGTVTEVTPIPSGAGGPISDVKVYYAMVDLDDGGFDGLRPGLSAEVEFLVKAERKVTRVPLAAIRWVDGKAYAAVVRESFEQDEGAAPAGSPAWEWRTVALGQSDPDYAEVVTGLAPGERVVTTPELLPPPRHPRTNPAIAGVTPRTGL